MVRTAVRLARLLAPGDREPDHDVHRRQALQSSCSPCRCISGTAQSVAGRLGLLQSQAPWARVGRGDINRYVFGNRERVGVRDTGATLR